MKVDGFACLSVLCQKGMSALHSDLSADLGCWRDFSIHAHPPVSVRIGEIRDLLVLCGCPGMIAYLQ